MTLQELQARRQELATKIRELADKFDQKTGQWTDSEIEGNWNQLNADYDANLAEMEQIKRSDAVSARLAAIQEHLENPAGAVDPPPPPVDTPKPGNDDFSGALEFYGGRKIAKKVPRDENTTMRAIGAWMKGQYGYALENDDWAACKACGIHPMQGHLDLFYPRGIHQNLNNLYRAWNGIHPNRRDLRQGLSNFKLYNAPLTTTTPTSGGNLIIPEILLAQLEINMLAFGGMREVSELIVTSGGETMGWPTADDTGNKGRIVAENTPADDNAGGGTSGDGGPNPTFGKVQWNAFKYTSDTILVPYELLEDSIIDLPPVLGAMLGERIGRITNEHYTVGAGTTEPFGIVTQSTLGHTAGSATLIDPDDVYDLQHSVDPAYRNGAAFMCHDSTIAHLRKLKDTTDRYLWQDGFQDGVPDLLAGSPIVVNQDMAAVASTTIPLIFGQLSKYKIRRVNGMRMYRLQERYREKDQDGFVAFLREDGNLLDAGTAPVKHLQMAV